VQVHASASELQGVLVNLIVNARSAMPQGGTLAIRLAAEPPLARITVEDTGCGMTSEVRQRIFEPFFTTKPEGEGTGLGLAICKEVIDAHDGHLDCRSALGVGTTFTILLPLLHGRG
jgi:signal transduction histidine kinase